MQKKFFSVWIILFILGANLMSACGGEETAEAVADTADPPAPTEMTYCDIAPSDICLISFGYSEDDNLLVTFGIDDPVYLDTYLNVKHKNDTFTFTCEKVENFTDKIYCSGEKIKLDEPIDLTMFSTSGDLLARGAFIIEQGNRAMAVTPTALQTVPTSASTQNSVTPTPTPRATSYPSKDYH